MGDDWYFLCGNERKKEEEKSSGNKWKHLFANAILKYFCKQINPRFHL